MQQCVILFLFLTSECAGFGRRLGKARSPLVLEMTSDIESTRRSFLTLSGVALASLVTVPEEASARDELFKPNPLTNPLLEQVRNKNQIYIMLELDIFILGCLI